MTIEEVIAIAKTLRPGFYYVEERKSDKYVADAFRICYCPQFDNDEFFIGNSWESVLQEAGWKG